VGAVASSALLCLLILGHSATRSVELVDVPVSSNAFPAYYGGARNNRNAQQVASMTSVGGKSLAATGHRRMQVLAESPDCGEESGVEVVVTTLCTSMVPGGGLAALPYAAPAYGPAYGVPYTVPVGNNAYQAPTVWQGDHVVSGGEPEWAAEDAAQHALNLANWRIKLLQAKLEQAKLAAKVMNVAAPAQSMASNNAPQLRSSSGKTQAELKAMQQGLISLASSTSDAVAALSRKIDGHSSRHHRSYLAKLKQIKQSTDSQLADILKKIDGIAGH